MFRKSIFWWAYPCHSEFFNAQTTVYGYIKDEQGKPIERVEVDLKESDEDVTADKIGYFNWLICCLATTKSLFIKTTTKPTSLISPLKEKRKDLGTAL